MAHLLPVGLPQGVTRNVTVTDIWESCFQHPGAEGYLWTVLDCNLVV